MTSSATAASRREQLKQIEQIEQWVKDHSHCTPHLTRGGVKARRNTHAIAIGRLAIRAVREGYDYELSAGYARIGSPGVWATEYRLK